MTNVPMTKFTASACSFAFDIGHLTLRHSLPMCFIQNFIKNPVKVTVFVILLVMFGLIAIARMPIQLIPDVQIPTLRSRPPGPAPALRKSKRRSSTSRRSSSKASKA